MKTINLLDTLNRVERELTRLSSELGDWDASEQKTLDDVRALIAMHADQPATGKAVRFEDVREFVREVREATALIRGGNNSSVATKLGAAVRKIEHALSACEANQ